MRAHTLHYRGWSLAMFGKQLFDEFSKPTDRPFLTNDLKKEISGRQRGKCSCCGDALEGVAKWITPFLEGGGVMGVTGQQV